MFLSLTSVRSYVWFCKQNSFIDYHYCCNVWNIILLNIKLIFRLLYYIFKWLLSLGNKVFLRMMNKSYYSSGNKVFKVYKSHCPVGLFVYWLAGLFVYWLVCLLVCRSVGQVVCNLRTSLTVFKILIWNLKVCCPIIVIVSATFLYDIFHHLLEVEGAGFVNIAWRKLYLKFWYMKFEQKNCGIMLLSCSFVSPLFVEIGQGLFP